MDTALRIWCVTDDKPGHSSQLLGLTNAQSASQRVHVRWLDCNRGNPIAADEKPHVIVAAGHRTHLKALSLRARFGGKLVVLMSPSLPRWLFDLCVIPEHDGVTASRRVITTRGTINDIPCSQSPENDRGLLMIGGGSKHHIWSDEGVVEQIRSLMRLMPQTHWTLSTSRRTPDTFLGKAQAVSDDRLQLVPHEQTDRKWLLDQYNRSSMIWTTEDSVSMVYEALSTGARVGVLAVPRRRSSRVSRGLDRLIRSGSVYPLAKLKSQRDMPGAGWPLTEASRVAAYLNEWLRQGEPSAGDESPAGIA